MSGAGRCRRPLVRACSARGEQSASRPRKRRVQDRRRPLGLSIVATPPTPGVPGGTAEGWRAFDHRALELGVNHPPGLDVSAKRGRVTSRVEGLSLLAQRSPLGCSLRFPVRAAQPGRLERGRTSGCIGEASCAHTSAMSAHPPRAPPFGSALPPFRGRRPPPGLAMGWEGGAGVACPRCDDVCRWRVLPTRPCVRLHSSQKAASKSTASSRREIAKT